MMMLKEQAMLDTVAASISEVRRTMLPEQHVDVGWAVEAIVDRITREMADCVEDFDAERFNMIAFTDDWERYV